jgi:hypothetical protein
MTPVNSAKTVPILQRSLNMFSTLSTFTRGLYTLKGEERELETGNGAQNMTL